MTDRRDSAEFGGAAERDAESSQVERSNARTDGNPVLIRGAEGREHDERVSLLAFDLQDDLVALGDSPDVKRAEEVEPVQPNQILFGVLLCVDFADFGSQLAENDVLLGPPKLG